MLFHAYRRWERLTFREALEALRPRLDLRIVYVLEEPTEGWQGERGRIDRALLARHLPDARDEHEYFVCGPEPMIHATERALRDNGVPMARVRSELFNLV